MALSPSREWTVIVAGLLVVQAVYGANGVFVGGLLIKGFSPFFLIYSSSVATFCFLLPFFLVFERRHWQRMGMGLYLRFVLIAAGVTAYQVLILQGVVRTSPAVSSSMMNLSPGFTFIISCFLRLEKLDIKEMNGKAKIIGTLTCLGGVIAISLLKNPPPTPPKLAFLTNLNPASFRQTEAEWMTGCAIIFAAIFINSCTTILQADTLKEFPLPLSLLAITYLIGGFLTATVQLVLEGRLYAGSSSSSSATTVTSVSAIGLLIAVGMGFQIWCIKKRGPVLATMFSPVSTVCSAILSSLVLGKNLGFRSILGIVAMFVGLYAILWAKYRESSSSVANGGEWKCGDGGLEEPLLH